MARKVAECVVYFRSLCLARHNVAVVCHINNFGTFYLPEAANLRDFRRLKVERSVLRKGLERFRTAAESGLLLDIGRGFLPHRTAHICPGQLFCAIVCAELIPARFHRTARPERDEIGAVHSDAC